MSARITLHCDQLWQYGGCTSQLITDAVTLTEARVAGEHFGWRCGKAGDFCPTCSGRPSLQRTNVVHLHMEES